MKIITHIFRVFVGVLFIFSGLIKINDPIGFSIKLKEYFEVFSTDFASFFHLFMPLSLSLAVILCLLEVVLGINLLTRHQPKTTINLLLLTIVFFTFLTFYSAYFNKVTDCGCFGDAIPLTPWQSFIKDIVLLVMIVWIFFRRDDLEPKMSLRGRNAFFVLSLVISFFLAVIAIRHLPFLDFRAYKIGVNIEEAMQPSAPLEYIYVMEKDGQTFEMADYPTDASYTYKDMKIKNPEVLPKITDYSIWNNEGDFTQATFEGTKMLFIMHDISKIRPKAFEKVKPVFDLLNERQIVPMVITASTEEEFKELAVKAGWPDLQVFFGDATVLKTMVRSNPGLILLKEGTVIKKWAYRDTPTATRLDAVLN